MTEGARRRDVKPADIGAGFIQIRKPPEKLSEWVKKNIPDRLIMTPSDYRKLLDGIVSLEDESKQHAEFKQHVERSNFPFVDLWRDYKELEKRLEKVQKWYGRHYQSPNSLAMDGERTTDVRITQEAWHDLEGILNG